METNIILLFEWHKGLTTKQLELLAVYLLNQEVKLTVGLN